MSIARTGNNLYIVCTSGTRPSAPTEGMMIYETDTDLLYLYNGGWVLFGSASSGAFSPTGAVSPFAGSSSPTGWLLCDGTAVSRTTYATLFGVISTTYGNGDGSTTFNVPDLRGRTALGAGTGTASGATAWSLGTTPTSGAGGEQTHLLSGAESGTSVHTHGDNFTTASDSHSHAAGSGLSFVRLGANNSAGLTIASGGSAAANTASDSHTHTINGSVSNSSAANASSAHNIMGPLTVVNFIIKT